MISKFIVRSKNVSSILNDVIALTQSLVRFPSITPDSEAILDWCQELLEYLEFVVQRLEFNKVNNLYAVWGNPNNLLLFCGHVDVVSPGTLNQWSYDPFAAEIVDQQLIGRGVTDMKGSIAAYFTALYHVLTKIDSRQIGFAILLTGDEENDSTQGAMRAIPYLIENGEKWIGCITGEPTGQKQVGDTFKYGRRGSLNGELIINGLQGHTGYPKNAINAAHAIIEALNALRKMFLDQGCDHFEPSYFTITSIDINNPVSNIIPNQAKALFNFRFNTQQNIESLKKNSIDCVTAALSKKEWQAVKVLWQWFKSSDPFLSKDDTFISFIRHAIKKYNGLFAKGSTEGGTSDSRFIYMHAPVIDLGLCCYGMHSVNESVALIDLYHLQAIYEQILILHYHQSLKN